MPTYKQFKKFLRDKCWNERDYGEWIYDKLIYDFLVEEIKENKEPQFTPWQMVEVSNDGEKWYKYIFSRIVSDKYICCVDTYHWQYECSYRFARPIEDKIEPLPEFDSNHIEWECVYQDRSVRQISLLTIAVNKLIAKQN